MIFQQNNSNPRFPTNSGPVVFRAAFFCLCLHQVKLGAPSMSVPLSRPVLVIPYALSHMLSKELIDAHYSGILGNSLQMTSWFLQ